MIGFIGPKARRRLSARPFWECRQCAAGRMNGASHQIDEFLTVASTRFDDAVTLPKPKTVTAGCGKRAECRETMMKQFGLALAVALRFFAAGTSASGATLLLDSDVGPLVDSTATLPGWTNSGAPEVGALEPIDMEASAFSDRNDDFSDPLNGAKFEPASPSAEPVSWATMLSGFGLLGAMLRAQRRGYGFA